MPNTMRIIWHFDVDCLNTMLLLMIYNLGYAIGKIALYLIATPIYRDKYLFAAATRRHFATPLL